MDKYLEIIGSLSQILGAAGLLVSLASFMIISRQGSLGIALLSMFIGFSFSTMLFTIKPIMLGVARIEANTRRLVSLASSETYVPQELEEPYKPKHEQNKNNDSFLNKLFNNKIFWLIIVDVFAVIILVYLFFLM